MILKPIAKPVRIRIKSGGMEHSSVESLKSHFVVDDIKDLVADGRLSRWLEQQNHRSIPNDILDLKKDSLEFTLAVYRFFFDEKNEMSDGEVYYCLYQETGKDVYLNKSAEEHFPKALIELDERRKKAEEEARIRKEEEERNTKEEYLMIGKDRYVELYRDCGRHSRFETNLSSLESNSYRILMFREWQYLVAHISINHPLYDKYKNNRFFVYKSEFGHYYIGELSSPSFFSYSVEFITTAYNVGTLLLFKDVEV